MRGIATIASCLCLGLAATGCGDPCRELSEKVCSCELDPMARRRCEQKVAVRAGLFTPPKDPRQNDAERQACADRLPTCECPKLAQGDLAACGLSPAAAP